MESTQRTRIGADEYQKKRKELEDLIKQGENSWLLFKKGRYSPPPPTFSTSYFINKPVSSFETKRYINEESLLSVQQYLEKRRLEDEKLLEQQKGKGEETKRCSITSLLSTEESFLPTSWPPHGFDQFTFRNSYRSSATSTIEATPYDNKPISSLLLPDELLYYIFSFMDEGLQVARIGRVCQRWLQVSRDNRLWEQYFKRDWPFRLKDLNVPKNATTNQLTLQQHQYNTNTLTSTTTNNILTTNQNEADPNLSIHSIDSLIQNGPLHNHSGLNKTLIDSRCETRWKGLYIEASEERHQQLIHAINQQINLEIEKCGVVIRSFMVHPPFSYTKFRSYKLLSKFYEDCLLPLLDETSSPSRFIPIIKSSGLSFIAIFFFEHSLYFSGLNPSSSAAVWKDYLCSDDFVRYCRDFEPGRKTTINLGNIMNCWDLREEVAKILGIKSVFLFDGHGKEFAEKILENKEMFGELRTSGKIPLSLFIGDLYLMLNDMMHIPYTTSMPELFQLIQQQHRERSLQEKVKLLLKLEEISSSNKLSTEETRSCLQTLNNCDEELQSAIRKQNAKFHIVPRHEFEESSGDEWPILVPWDVQLDELKELLGFKK